MNNPPPPQSTHSLGQGLAAPATRDPRTQLANLRQILLASEGAVTEDDYEKCTAALDCLDSVLGDWHLTRDGPTVEARGDAELLRQHHAKMAARIAAIDLDLAAIKAKRAVLWAPVHPTRRQSAKNAKETEQALKDFDTEQAALEHERAVCDYIITPEAFHSSPIRRIPNEILADIFVAAKDGEPDRIGTGIASIVTRVCARWRNVACTHPRLWSDFACPLFGREDTVDLLRITLDRCKANSLTVIVDASARVATGLSGNRTLALLAAHAENIVQLRFRGETRVLDPVREGLVFRAFRGRLPRLELLGFTHVWRVVGDAFAQAPRLHTLEMGRSADLTELKSLLPASQIRSIRLSMSTSGYHLGTFPNLATLVSVQTNQSLPVVVPGHPPRLERLTTWHAELPKPQEANPTHHMMAVHHTPPVPNTAVNFFTRFCTPGLQTLHLRRFTSVEGVIELIHRSRCALTSLVLDEPLTTAADLLHLLAETPDLHTLTVLSGEPAVLDDNLLKALTLRNDPLNDVLPCLMHLRVEGSAYEFGTDALLAMLESRTSASSVAAIRLRKVDITLRDRVFTPDRVRWLTRREDVAVSITDMAK
ncbi:hypothetical protein B0H13DRAFT_2276841 [Mycena leptocephala]|nr:hypothetical protein B0H13DRAFT_2276841 [Mycena leptocephala]